jgi:hypothetical protein
MVSRAMVKVIRCCFVERCRDLEAVGPLQGE